MSTTLLACYASSCLTAADSAAVRVQVDHSLARRICPTSSRLNLMHSDFLVRVAKCSMSQSAELVFSSQSRSYNRCHVMQVNLPGGKDHFA